MPWLSIAEIAALSPLAVSMGDPAGIGPEIIAKAWVARKTAGLPPFFAVGDARAIAGVWSGPMIAITDLAVVTDDNPRSEEPAAIRADILKGAPGAIDHGDRRGAIRLAIAQAQGDDIVLIAGKGHEQGQIVGDLVLPFDDVSVAREVAGEA